MRPCVREKELGLCLVFHEADDKQTKHGQAKRKGACSFSLAPVLPSMPGSELCSVSNRCMLLTFSGGSGSSRRESNPISLLRLPANDHHHTQALLALLRCLRVLWCIKTCLREVSRRFNTISFILCFVRALRYIKLCNT